MTSLYGVVRGRAQKFSSAPGLTSFRIKRVTLRVSAVGPRRKAV